MSRFVPLAVVLCCCLILIPTASRAQETCYADFDVNGDGMPLSVSDYITAIRILSGDTTIPVEWYRLDLNGDCMIDAGDIEMAECYFQNGLSCFPNGFPVPTCCNPDTVAGACCLGDSCSIRTLANCTAIGGTYKGDGAPCGDYACDCCEGMRDEVNGDNSFNVSDLVYFIAYLFRGGPEPPCFEEADFNADGVLDIRDLVGAMIPAMFRPGNWIFLPCPGEEFPIDLTYEVHFFDTTSGNLLSIDTLFLNVLAPNVPNGVHGSLEPGSSIDSVMGTWYTDSLFMTNANPIFDGGFETWLYPYNGTWAGVWNWITIAGYRPEYVIMYPIEVLKRE